MPYTDPYARPRRRLAVPGLADDVGLPEEADAYADVPGLDLRINDAVDEALRAEGITLTRAGIEPDPYFSVPSSVRPGYTPGPMAGSGLAQTLPTQSGAGFSAEPFARSLRPGARLAADPHLPAMQFSPEETAAIAEAETPVPGTSPSRSVGNALTSALASAFPVTSSAFRALPGAASALSQRLQNAPAPAVAGAVPAGAPPAVSPSSPGAQPQGAGAATPPGQPAPSPVTPAPSSDQPQQRGELATVAEAFGQPAAAKDTTRSDKMLRASAAGTDGFGMTDTERARLEEARAGDRRMRIGAGVAQGIGALLGTIGAATDRPGLAGLGMTGMQVGRSIPAGRRADEVLADIERRQQALGAQQTAEARQAQLATEADRVGVQRLGAEANMIRAQGQAQLDAQQAATEALERELAAGNTEAAREQIRGRIAAMPSSPERDALIRAYRRGGPFDQQNDPDILRATLAQFGDVDTPGESIARTYRGGTEVQWVADPVTGAATRIEVQAGGGGRRAPDPVADPFAAPVAPTEAPGAVPATTAPVAAPGARPARPAARRGRPAPGVPAPVAAPAPAGTPPAPVPGAAGAPPPAGGAQPQPIDLSNQGHVSDFEAMMENEGVRRGSGSWNRRRDNFIRTLETGTDAQKNAAIGEVREALRQASIAEAGGLEAGSTPEQRRMAASSDFRSAMRERSRIARLIPRIRRAMRDNPEDFALAARYVGQDMPLPPNASRIAQEMSRGIILQLKEMSGAAVTDSELQRTLQSFGVGNWSRVLGDPDGYVRSLEQALGELENYTDAMVRTGIGARVAAPIYSSMLGGSADEWSTVMQGWR